MSQSQTNFFEQSNGQGQIPSRIYDGEDSSDPLLFNQQQPMEETISTQRQTNQRAHTAPKILVSVLHKILYWDKQGSNKFKDELSNVNLKSNNSTVIKLILLGRKTGFIQKLISQFGKVSQEKINRLRIRKQWTQIRIDAANDWKIRIQRCLRQKSYQGMLPIIWRNHKHKGKHQACESQVKAYAQKIKKIQKKAFIKGKK